MAQDQPDEQAPDEETEVVEAAPEAEEPLPTEQLAESVGELVTRVKAIRWKPLQALVGNAIKPVFDIADDILGVVEGKKKGEK